MKLEVKKIRTKPRKLKVKWKVEPEVDAPAFYSPNVSFMGRTNWSTWGDKFTWLPRKSIYGKTIWGRVQYRHEMNAWGKVPLTSGVKQWATEKEVFESKLRNDREEIEVADACKWYKRKTGNGSQR